MVRGLAFTAMDLLQALSVKCAGTRFSRAFEDHTRLLS